MSTPLPDQHQITALSHRIETVAFRVESQERNIEEIKQQFREFARTRENELQFLNIQATVTRLERDVSETKRENGDLKKELERLQTRWLVAILSGSATIILIILGLLLSRVFG